jgi:hypothetical protein
VGEGGNGNPTRDVDEEAKNNSNSGNNYNKKEEKDSYVTKSMNMLKSSAQSLASKVSFNKVDQSNEDPSRYH